MQSWSSPSHSGSTWWSLPLFLNLSLEWLQNQWMHTAQTVAAEPSNRLPDLWHKSYSSRKDQESTEIAPCLPTLDRKNKSKPKYNILKRRVQISATLKDLKDAGVVVSI